MDAIIGYACATVSLVTIAYWAIRIPIITIMKLLHG